MKVGIFVLAFICFFFVFCDEGPSKTEIAEKEVADSIDWETIDRVVKKLTEEGLIKKIDFEARNAWIDPVGWMLIDAEAKENLARTIAYYCAHKAGDQIYFSGLYDGQSGKKIAKYDALGFKVY